MYPGQLRSFEGCVWKSILYRPLFSVYLIAGVVLATVHPPIIVRIDPSLPSSHQVEADRDLLATFLKAQFQLNIGEPPVSIFHVVRIVIAGWFSFFGVFWDVQKRLKEWALIRLYGGHPSFVAAAQYFCLILMGSLIGGGLALLIEPARSMDNAVWLLLTTVIWGLIFSCCLSIGPIIYTEFCDEIAILRVEG